MKVPSKEEITQEAEKLFSKSENIDAFECGAEWMEQQLEPLITELEMDNKRLKEVLEVVRNYLSTKTVDGFEAYTIVEKVLKPKDK